MVKVKVIILLIFRIFPTCPAQDYIKSSAVETGASVSAPESPATSIAADGSQRTVAASSVRVRMNRAPFGGSLTLRHDGAAVALTTLATKPSWRKKLRRMMFDSSPGRQPADTSITIPARKPLRTAASSAGVGSLRHVRAVTTVTAVTPS